MRFFSALLAIPLIGAVLGNPVPAKQEEKRLLGLDNLLQGSSGSAAAGSTDLAGILDQMNADLGPSFDILYGVRGEDANVVEGVLGNIKGTLETVFNTIKNNVPAGQAGSPDEIAGKLKPFLENMSGSLGGLPDEVTSVPVVGDLIGALEAYAGSLVVLLKWFVGEQLEDALRGAAPALSGTVGGILSNLLSLGAA